MFTVTGRLAFVLTILFEAIMVEKYGIVSRNILGSLLTWGAMLDPLEMICLFRKLYDGIK